MSLDDEILQARRSIGRLRTGKRRPTQQDIARATGLTQSYVSKILKCTFTSLNAGVLQVLEYSQKSPSQRAQTGADREVSIERVHDALARIESASPASVRVTADIMTLIAEIAERAAAK